MAATFTGVASFTVVPRLLGRVFALSDMGARELMPTANEHHVGLPGIAWADGVLTIDAGAMRDIVTEVYVGIGLNQPQADFSRTPLNLLVTFGRSRPGTLSVPLEQRPGNNHAVLARVIPTKSLVGIWAINRLTGQIAFPDRAALVRRCRSAGW